VKTIQNKLTISYLNCFLAITLLYFICKGIDYLFLGSYIPILFIMIVIALISWSVSSGKRFHFRLVKAWAAFVIIWSLVRLILSLVLLIDQHLSESHLREQFGILQNTISLLMFLMGVGIMINLRKRSS